MFIFVKWLKIKPQIQQSNVLYAYTRNIFIMQINIIFFFIGVGYYQRLQRQRSFSCLQKIDKRMKILQKIAE